MNFDLADNEKEILATVQKFCREKVSGRAITYDKEARFPVENFADLHKLGIIGLSIPREYGGGGIGLHHRTLVEIMVVEELAKRCSSTGHTFHNHNSPLEVIASLGTEEQKRRYFGDVVNNGAVVGIWASERGGKNIFDMKTTARKTKGGYLLNGQKFFSTNSGGATWGQVWAIDPDDDNKLVISMVRMDTQGVKRLNDWDPLGQRGTTSGSTVYENVFVPDENIIGQPGEYYQMPLFGPYFQLGWAAVYVGIAAGALEAGIEYVKTKSRPWGETELDRAVDDPYIQNHVADMSTNVEAARMLLYRAANKLDEAAKDAALRSDACTAIYQAKVLATEVSLDVSSRIFQIAGARMVADAPKSGVDMYWRNARTFTLHDPVDYRRQRIGKYLLTGENPPVGWF